MKHNIKNMVCTRCEWYVKQAVEAVGLTVASLRLGELVLTKPATDEQRNRLSEQLSLAGLELLGIDKNLIVEKIKVMVNEFVNQFENASKLKLSVHLSENLKYNYSYLSNVFSKSEGITIRDYCIQLRIESAKRMLMNEGLNLGDIAFYLNYSSRAHFAAQFKKITGVTTTEFKRFRSSSRMQISLAG